MSPNNPGNFVNDLVEMAKAFEALPKVQADLELARGELEAKATTIQRLELKLADRANEVQDGLARIRKLEEEKDATETMFLEADDRTARALDFIKATFGNAGSLIQALEPMKATPPTNADDGSMHELVREQPPLEPIPNVNVPDPAPEALHTTQSQGQSEADPTASTDHSEANASTTSVSSEASVMQGSSPASEVAPAHPTPTTDADTPKDTTAPEGSASDTVTPEANATGNQSFPMPSISPGRYSGKTYSAAKRDEAGHFTWPNRDEWLDGGGTLDNFYA